MEDVEDLEGKYGRPVEARMHFELNPWEYDVVEASMQGGRAHDVTMFIRSMENPDMIAVIKKPFFPPGAYRAPSGAAKRGEGLESGALREAREETGLEIELVRYLARIYARFTRGGETIDWTSHIFEVRQTGGVLEPQDTDEIAEARWASTQELKTGIRASLLEAGWDLFRYRVALTDLSMERMEGDHEV